MDNTCNSPHAMNKPSTITLAASQQTVAALREAGTEFVQHYPCGISPFLDRAWTQMRVALSSTPAPALVLRDTERLDWLEAQGCYCGLHTKQLRAAIDAELDRTKGAE